MSVIASSNKAVISFHTDNAVTKNGFQFFFEFIGKHLKDNISLLGVTYISCHTLGGLGFCLEERYRML